MSVLRQIQHEAVCTSFSLRMSLSNPNSSWKLLEEECNYPTPAASVLFPRILTAPPANLSCRFPRPVFPPAASTHPFVSRAYLRPPYA